MKRKIISAIIVLFCAGCAWLWVLYSTKTRPTPIIAQPEKGHNAFSQPIQASSAKHLPESLNANQLGSILSSISEKSIEEIQDTVAAANQLLLAAPDDQSGKQSTWFKSLSDWQIAWGKFAHTRSRNDLFAIVPIAAPYLARDRENEWLSDSLVQAGHVLHGPCFHIIHQLAASVSEGNGVLDAKTGDIALQVFSNLGIVSEPDWEDADIPLDAAGVLIALADNATLFERLSHQQIAYFVSTSNAQAFFRRYEDGGNGLPALQRRFAEKRQAIESLFSDLAAKAATYQASKESKQ